jgi:hypothetical protein
MTIESAQIWNLRCPVILHENNVDVGCLLKVRKIYKYVYIYIVAHC